MNVGISMEELLAWDRETSAFWKAHLGANPALLQLSCSIGGARNVQDLVRHIWGVELRWAQRLAGLSPLAKEDMPAGPLDALYDMHLQAVAILGRLFEDSSQNWEATIPLDISGLPAHARTPSRRKIAAHALLHSQRHWAQLATLVRDAGVPSKFFGDFLGCSAVL
jgi:uncharacterized damage-inducible protein DinB